MRSALCLVFGLIVLVASCSKKKSVKPEGPNSAPAAVNDSIPPAAVTDLAISAVTLSTVTLRWTAPGNDGMTGRARRFAVRYADSLIPEESWARATAASTVPGPSDPGSHEACTVTGLTAGQLYYFAVRTGDDGPNWSRLSHCVGAPTPAAQQLTASTQPGGVREPVHDACG